MTTLRFWRDGSGHILIDAQDGDVIIKGRNIRLSAEDGSGEITLVSGKHVYIKGAVCHIKGTNINILGSNNLSMSLQPSLKKLDLFLMKVEQ